MRADANFESIDDARAEFVLHAFVNDISAYDATYQGLFYSGYSDDLIQVDTQRHDVQLARNGLFHTLPQSLFFEEDYLRRSTADPEKLLVEHRRQKQTLEAFCRGIDNVFFHRSVQLEQTLSEIDTDAPDMLLRALCDIDTADIRHPLVRQLARLLLRSRTLKGNLSLLAYFSSQIIGHPVECQQRSLSHGDDPSFLYPSVRFVVYIDNLSAAEYRTQYERLEDYFDRLADWFLPYDCESSFAIKQRGTPLTLDGTSVLDYNTWII